MRGFIRNNGLTLALMGLFSASLVGMLIAGHAQCNDELIKHGQAPLGWASYAVSSFFLSALFENWESEFLQMAVYVVLTAILFQRGSAESRDPDSPGRAGDGPRSPGILAWLYGRSLGLALGVLFVLSLGLHWWHSMQAANAQALWHGGTPRGFWAYGLDSSLWFESFQNWQSEFLSTAVLVVLSIFLRQRGSPESKPVQARNSET